MAETVTVGDTIRFSFQLLQQMMLDEQDFPDGVVPLIVQDITRGPQNDKVIYVSKLEEHHGGTKLTMEGNSN